MHMIMWAMSDRAIPRSFRMMEGFGVHTFRLVNAEGESTFVKFHWKPKLGMQSVVWDEAVKIDGADPDFHRRDLWNAIQSGDFPEWELGLQLFDEAFADALRLRRARRDQDHPGGGGAGAHRRPDGARPHGRQLLRRDRAGRLLPQNIVPGIDFTNDPLLQGRNFSYLDTQLKRLGGPNFTHIPINAPSCPMHHFQQDGHMQMRGPKGRANYEPNSWARGRPARDPTRGFRSFPEPVERREAQAPRRELRRPLQPGAAVLPQPDADRAAAHRRRLVFELSKVETPAIRERVVAHLPPHRRRISPARWPTASA